MLTPLLALSSFNVQAGCDFSTSRMLPGETRMLLVCGEAISQDSTLQGLSESGIDITYRQNLRRCDFHDKRPGLFLELAASVHAKAAALIITDTAGVPVCSGLLEVPQLTVLENAELTRTAAADTYLLRLTDPDVSFEQSCASLRFPERGGPSITPLRKTLACSADELRVQIRMEAGSTVTPHLRTEIVRDGGRSEQALSYIPLPPPRFANDMLEADAKHVDVNGVRTRYFAKGAGETLVLVHGGQPSAPDFNAWEWQQNIAGLAKHFRVIVPDRIGQGGTDNPADLSAYDNYYPLVVEHLKGFLDALDLDQVHLVGHSQGGWPVMRITLDQPQRVSSLTIVDSTMVAKSSNAAAAIQFYMYHQTALHPASGPTRQSIRRGLESFSFTNNNISDQRVDRILEISRTQKFRDASDMFDRLRMSPAHPTFRKLKEQVWAELLAGELTTPTLIIWGREDPEGSFPAGVAMYESLRDAGSPVRFHAFEKAGHVAYMEYPEAFNEVVINFVSASQSLPSITSAQ